MKKQKTFNQELDHILQVLDAEIKKKEYFFSLMVSVSL